MVRTNIDRLPHKKAWGITINGEGSSAPKKRRQLPPGDKGKSIKHTTERVDVNTQVNVFETEDEQPLIFQKGWDSS